MLAFDGLPDLTDHGFALILVLIVTFWVFMKVKFLRERIALRGDGEAPPAAPAWQHALARSPWTFPVLGIVAVGAIVAMIVLGVVV